MPMPAAICLTLQNRRNALPACGADRDQTTPAACCVEQFGQVGDNPASGRRKRVPRRQ